MTYRYRCKRRTGEDGKHCDTWVVLPRKVEDYTRKPKCPTCGHYVTYLDNSAHRKIKRETCNCDGRHFPHRRGSRLCNYYEGELTEEEMRDRHYQRPKGNDNL